MKTTNEIADLYIRFYNYNTTDHGFNFMSGYEYIVNHMFFIYAGYNTTTYKPY